MPSTNRLSSQHPALGQFTVLPYGRNHSLVDVAGPGQVSALHRWLTSIGVSARPGWSSVLIDDSNRQRVHDLVLSADPGATPSSEAHHVTIDVVYDGVDLPVVADHCGISVDEVIDRHSGAHYSVVFVGFTRAFAYLSGLDPLLATVPRLPTPRVRVPRGSVGIAAGQTGIYPIDSPGGWNLLGSTQIELFDPSRTPPSLLMPGDTVSFRVM